MATSTDALSTKPAPRYRLELAIAIAAVVMVVLVTAVPGFLVAVLCVGLVVIAVVNFDLFVCATVFFLPWYPLIDWSFPLHDVLLPTRFLILAVVAARRVRQGASLKSWLWQSWLSKGVWLFAFFEVVSLLSSDYRAVGGPYPSLAKQLSYIALFFGVSGWSHSPERISRVLKIVLISALGVCAFGLYQSLAGGFTGLYFSLYPRMEAVYEAQGGWQGRITSLLFHYNSLAGYLNTVAPLALGVAVLAKDRGLRALGFICLVAVGAALYLTGSRGGLVAYSAIAMTSVFYLKPRRKTVAVFLIASILAASVGLLFGYLGSLEGERYRDVGDFTLQSRLAIWGAATVIFLQHPFLGAGVGTFRYRFHPYVPGIKDDLDAHNLYLHTLAETGIIGFLLFFATMWGFFRRGDKLTKIHDELGAILGIAVMGALAALTVHGLVDYIFLVSPQFGGLFWTMMGLGTAAGETFGLEGRTKVLREVSGSPPVPVG
jgi:O-antigen ligase